MRSQSCILIAMLMAVAGSQAGAASNCADLFAAMGRTYVADAAPVSPAIPATERILDCPANQIMQFAYDFAAERDATAVVSADQLVGTWVSDDILGIVSGLFIPVYEVFEISPGAADGEVTIVQKLFRYADPAEMLFSAGLQMPPVDVVAAGRIATYGEHVAVLAKPGQLEPRRVRYYDFPIEGDRYTGLAMKLRMASFLQTQPIDIRSDGTRLVIELFDRLSPGGSRIMTFRRRDPASPDRALKLIVLAEIAASHFHCLMEATEKPSAAFLEALGQVRAEDFFRAVDTAYAYGLEMQEVRAKLTLNAQQAEREAARGRFLEIAEKNRALFESGPLNPLTKSAASGAPLGCPSLY